MECNRDEATRAKAIAECKLAQKDYAFAKKLALKAESLYPGLDGISHTLTTLEVYLAAENKVRGEIDWYGVLGVNPSDDDETIKRQYRRLALKVHPDKNTSIGAEGAFKLISEAWRFLSDKAKRLEYNKRRSCKGVQQNVRTQTGGPSAPSRPSQPNVSTYTGVPSAPSRSNEHKGPGPSSPSNCASRETSAPKPQDRSAKAPRKRTHVPSQQPVYTFWTTCSQCAAQFEYLRKFCSCILLCKRCHKPFAAFETVPPPPKFVKPATLLRWRSTVNY